MDRFIDTLEGSPELKAWMKKHHTVNLQGKDFTSHLTGDDIVGVQEFLDAYTTLNGGTHSGGLPEPKYKESDKTKNPEKYEREHAQYIDSHAKVREGQPGLARRPRRGTCRQESRPALVAARQASSASAPNTARCNWRKASTSPRKPNPAWTAADHSPDSLPATYWLTTLDTPALAGDVRLRWDVPVTVRAGETTRVELSNVNAIEPARPSGALRCSLPLTF